MQKVVHGTDLDRITNVRIHTKNSAPTIRTEVWFCFMYLPRLEYISIRFVDVTLGDLKKQVLFSDNSWQPDILALICIFENLSRSDHWRPDLAQIRHKVSLMEKILHDSSRILTWSVPFLEGFTAREIEKFQEAEMREEIEGWSFGKKGFKM